MEIKRLGNNAVQYTISFDELNQKFNIDVEDILEKKKNGVEFINSLIMRTRTMIADSSDYNHAEKFSISTECRDKKWIRFIIRQEIIPEDTEYLDMSIPEDSETNTVEEKTVSDTLGFGFLSFRELIDGCKAVQSKNIESLLIKRAEEYVLVIHSESIAPVGAAGSVLSEFANSNYIIMNYADMLNDADILIEKHAIEQIKKIFA